MKGEILILQVKAPSVSPGRGRGLNLLNKQNCLFNQLLKAPSSRSRRAGWGGVTLSSNSSPPQ